MFLSDTSSRYLIIMPSQHVFSTSKSISAPSLADSGLPYYELVRLCDSSTGIPHAGIAPIDPNRKSHARKQPEGRVKRPRNAWIRFRSDYVYLQKVCSSILVFPSHANIDTASWPHGES
jgi:hypothetical protein